MPNSIMTYLGQVSERDRQQILEALLALRRELSASRNQPLVGEEGPFYLRVGDWRVLYGIDEAAGKAVVLTIAPMA